MATSIIVLLCTAVIFAVCLMLVLHKHYEDGLFGRIALAVIGIAAFGRFTQTAERLVDGHALLRDYSSIAIILWVGLAMFMARHAYRFLRWRHSGENDWRNSKSLETGGKCS